mgnify:CR=1 FL=1
MIENVYTLFCDNYFPPNKIVVYDFENGVLENHTHYTEPVDGIWPKYSIGVWNVTYKNLNPDYYLAGQITNPQS